MYGNEPLTFFEWVWGLFLLGAFVLMALYVLKAISDAINNTKAFIAKANKKLDDEEGQ